MLQNVSMSSECVLLIEHEIVFYSIVFCPVWAYSTLGYEMLVGCVFAECSLSVCVCFMCVCMVIVWLINTKYLAGLYTEFITILFFIYSLLV